MHRSCIQSVHKSYVVPSEHSLAVTTYIYIYISILTHMFCHVWSCRVWVLRQQDWKVTEEPKDPWNILIYVWGSVQPTGDSPQKGFLTKVHQDLPESLLCLLEENNTVLSVSWIYSSTVINIYIKCFNLPSRELITKSQTSLLQDIFSFQWRDKKDSMYFWQVPLMFTLLVLFVPHLLVHCHST